MIAAVLKNDMRTGYAVSLCHDANFDGFLHASYLSVMDGWGWLGYPAFEFDFHVALKGYRHECDGR